MFLTDLMAIFTGRLLVRAHQDKISQLMIEPLRVEPDNIGVTANMLGMARRALLHKGILIATVVADSVFDVTGNIFMTGFA